MPGRLSLRPLILSSLLLLASVPALASSQICYRTELKTQPSWVSGATVSEDGSDLFLVDPVQNRILAYSSSGEVLPQFSVDAQAATTDRQPTAISRSESGGYFLEEADGTLLHLGPTLKTIQKVALAQAERTAGVRVGSFYEWKEAGRSIIAYGSLIDGVKIKLGFFRVPLSGGQNPKMLMPFSESDYYLIGNSYIATIGDTAYYLAMGQRPTIYRVPPDGAAKPLKAFPPEFRTRPDFKTRMTGPATAQAHFAELESFSVASGLYAQDGFLYVLTRKPEAGRTSWFLYRIDPQRDALLPGSLRLPTTANHLTVVPSQKFWYLIERGAVRERQKQTIESMVVVDDAAIQAFHPLPIACPAL